MIICGQEDRRTPVAVHEELAGHIPGARLRVIERAGHFTPLEEPRAVTDALWDWLLEGPPAEAGNCRAAAVIVDTGACTPLQ